uniref:protein PBDC1 isoform X2 n=1 Tax=Myxine glutinosa TaxID=7769 RepID=UPI00358EDCD0
MSIGGLESLGAGDALAAASALSRPAESCINDLISSAEPEFLHLTEQDDGIYNEFRRSFPTMMIAILNPEDLKSETSKEKWRAFCLLFDGKVAEFNFGTLLRLNATGEYSDENTIFATRIQFYAVEIARNREGCNTTLWAKTTEASKDGVTTTLSDDVQGVA